MTPTTRIPSRMDAHKLFIACFDHGQTAPFGWIWWDDQHVQTLPEKGIIDISILAASFTDNHQMIQGCSRPRRFAIYKKNAGKIIIFLLVEALSLLLNPLFSDFNPPFFSRTEFLANINAVPQGGDMAQNGLSFHLELPSRSGAC